MSTDETFEPVREPVNPLDVESAKAKAEFRDEPYRGVPHQGGQVVAMPPMGQLPLMAQPQKDGTAAWLLWFFLGGIGGHDFYLRSTGIGITKLILGLLSGLLTLVVIGYVGIFAIFCWNIVDAFRMGSRLQAVNMSIWQQNQRLMASQRPMEH